MNRRENMIGFCCVAKRDRHGSASTTAIIAILLFMSALMLVQMVMPSLVENLHYARERGRQRAAYEVAGEQLTGGVFREPIASVSHASQLVSQRIAPSVVHIDTRLTQSDESQIDHDDRGQGSGIIISANGRIMTNLHVVAGAEQIVVTLCDDRKFPASVEAIDEKVDLAMLSIEASELTPVEWADSDAIPEGSLVWAVGSPFGYSKTLTFGILSAKERRSRGQSFGYLQSDVAISPGSSGGPLVDDSGHVIGINTAMRGPLYHGVSFAIPSNTAVAMLEQSAEIAAVPRGWLGVRLAKGIDQPSSDGGTGVLVTGFVEYAKSPAKRAGIRPGDIIVTWDGNPVDSAKTLTSLVDQTEVNSSVTVGVLRGGETRRLNVQVGPRPLQF